MPRTTRTARSAPVVLAVVVALVLSVACSSKRPLDLSYVPPVLPDLTAPSATFSADAENGTLTNWSVAQNTVVSGGAAKNGSLGYRVAAAEQPAFLRLDRLGAVHRPVSASLSAWVRVDSRTDDTSVDLISLRNSTGVHNFDFYITRRTGRFKWDLVSSDSRSSDVTVRMGQWYFVQIDVEFGDSGSYRASVHIDGVNKGTIASDGQPPATLTELQLGSSLDKTNIKNYDDVQLTVRGE